MTTTLTKIIQVTIAILLLALFVPASGFSAAINLPQDNNGWTIFTPSSDSRIMYVSSSGNDGAGQVYNSNDSAVGADPFNPAGSVNAFRTYAAAYANTREGYPDWILLRRGDTFNEAIGKQMRSGRDGDEPFLIAWYGSGGNMPMMKTGSAAVAIDAASSTQNSFMAIVGIDFYSNLRDPGGSDYTGMTNRYGIRYVGKSGYTIQGLLFEGCKFRFYTNNTMEVYQATAMRDIAIRRCSFEDSYSGTEDGHSQGLYVFAIPNLLLEQNYFIHCGWYRKATSGYVSGAATQFNHSVYSGQYISTTIRENVSIAPSSAHFKTEGYGEGATSNNLFENNLMIDGEVAISTGNNGNSTYSIVNNTYMNNVATHVGLSDPTSRGLSWGMYVTKMDSCLFSNNLLMNFVGYNTVGVYLRTNTRNTVWEQNKFINMNSVEFIRGESGTSNVSGNTFRNNEFQNASQTDYGVRSLNGYNFAAGYSFNDNTWYTEDGTGTGFMNSGSNMSFSAFNSAVGDSGSSFGQFNYPDSSRDIDTYQLAIGRTGTIDAFTQSCRAQSIFSWDERYMADTVNTWIRGGYFDGAAPDPDTVVPDPDPQPDPQPDPDPDPQPEPEPTPDGIAVSSVNASTSDGNVPSNTTDNNISTRWSAYGNGQWIEYDLVNEYDLSHLLIAFYLGDQRTASFDIHISTNGTTWHSVYSGNSIASAQQEQYNVTGKARYVRIIGNGNTSNDWNSITEVDIFGTVVDSRLLSPKNLQ